MICHRDNVFNTAKVTRLYQFEGLKRVECSSGSMGDIVAVNGITDMNIGDTICSVDCVEPLPFVNIDEPTVSMLFMVNNSPFAEKKENTLQAGTSAHGYLKKWKQTYRCA